MFPDDSGDRRSGHPRASPKTSVSRQDLGSRGQFGTDVVAATTAQADQRVHCPPAPAWTPCSVTVEPNTPLLTETDSGRRDPRLPPTPTAHQRPLVAGLARAGTFSPSLPATLTNKAVAAHTPPLPHNLGHLMPTARAGPLFLIPKAKRERMRRSSPNQWTSGGTSPDPP